MVVRQPVGLAAQLSAAMGTVIVAGLGPADASLIPARALELASTTPTWLRTGRHPAASAFSECPTFDHLYDAAAAIDEVYTAIAAQLVELAHTHGTVLYLVPGSPLVAERTVDLLRLNQRVEVVIEPAVSFLDLAWDRLAVDPLSAGVSLVDAHTFEERASTATAPLLIGQCDSRFVLSDIKLAFDAEELPTVTVLQRLGLADESVFDVAWVDLDRGWEPDHLTSIYVPWLPDRPSAAMAELHRIVGRLRAECPWDRDQSHQSLTRFAIEEAQEVADAVASMDADDPSAGEIADVVSELGDLLFQVSLHSAIGEESGDFEFVDVVRSISEKMIRRHPHVFDRAEGSAPPTMSELAGQWDRIKAAERTARAALGNDVEGQQPPT